MKYLLFVYGENENINNEEVTTNIAKELQPVTFANTQIKYIYGSGNAIYHFSSDMKFPEMSIYIDILIEEFEDFMYVLIPFDGVIGSNAGETRLKHLLDLEEDSENILKSKNEIDFEDFGNHDDFVFDFFINIINNKSVPNTQICNMTLDELLDKILESGMESLSEVEKKKLEEYSK
jgi:hypothetical protein